MIQPRSGDKKIAHGASRGNANSLTIKLRSSERKQPAKLLPLLPELEWA